MQTVANVGPLGIPAIASLIRSDLGLAVSSLGVTLGPPLFGRSVELAGGYRGPWIGLALTMGAALALLALVRERRRLP